MRSLRPAFRGALVAAILVAAPRTAAGQEGPAPTDTIASDTLAGRQSPEPLGNPRLTWLGDTLPPADTLRPRFAAVPVVHADSVVDPYTIDRPGAWPAWEIGGDALLGRGAFNLLDVLESEAPIVGIDLGGPGVPAFLGSPLGTFTNVQVVIDGIPVGDPLRAAWDLRRIPLEAIARVAWWPGPQVAAWGGEGTGGVLEITTRRSLEPVATSHLGFVAGSFDAQAFAGSLARPVTSRGDVFVAANFDDSEGFVTTQGEFTRNQLVVKAGVRLGERHRLEVARWSDGLASDARRVNLFGDQDQDGQQVRLSYLGTIGPLSTRAHGYRESHQTDLNFLFREEAEGITGDGTRTGFRGDVSLPLGPVLVWGAAAREESEVETLHPAFSRADGSSLFEPATEDPTAPSLENPRRRTELGGGVGWGSDGLGMNAAIRRIDPGGAPDPGTSWQIEAVARPGAGVTARGALGRGIRPPDLVGAAILAGLAGDGMEIHPGREADPGATERWTTWQAEVAWRRPGLGLAGRAFDASGDGAFLWAPPTAWLYADRGLVDLVPLGDIPFNAYDQVDLSVTGFELEAEIELPLDVEGFAAVRRLETTEEFTGRPVPYLPANQALGQLRYARRFFPSRDLLVEARLTGRFVGDRPSVETEDLPAYLLGDALVQVTIINFTAFVSYRNFAGTAHRSEDAFGLPQREGYLGVVWRFRN